MKYRGIILLTIGLITLCSCAGKASNKAMVDPKNPAEVTADEPIIQNGITADVIKTSAYFDEFYSVSNRYMITDQNELEIFAGYMHDGSLINVFNNSLEENTLFIVPIQESSGGYRYSIKKAAIEEDTLSLLWHSEGDEFMTDDMAMYYPYALVPKELLKGKSCTDWVVPDSYQPTIYKTNTVSAEFGLDSISPAALRQTAEKYNAAQGTISLYAGMEKRKLICSFEVMDSENAKILTDELNSLGAAKASFYERTIQPSEYERYTGHSCGLSITDMGVNVFTRITDMKNYNAAANYFRNILNGKVTDEYISEYEFDNLYSLSVSMKNIADDNISALINSLEAVPYNTDELKISIYYCIN